MSKHWTEYTAEERPTLLGGIFSGRGFIMLFVVPFLAMFLAFGVVGMFTPHGWYSQHKLQQELNRPMTPLEQERQEQMEQLDEWMLTREEAKSV